MHHSSLGVETLRHPWLWESELLQRRISLQLIGLSSFQSNSRMNFCVWTRSSWARDHVPWILEDEPCQIPSWAISDVVGNGTEKSCASHQWGSLSQTYFETIQPLLTWSPSKLTLMWSFWYFYSLLPQCHSSLANMAMIYGDQYWSLA